MQNITWALLIEVHAKCESPGVLLIRYEQTYAWIFIPIIAA